MTAKRQPKKGEPRTTSISHVKGKGKSTQTPYLLINAGPQRGMRVHTLVAEAILGRELEKDETVEHRDGDGLNNRWTNIRVVTRAVNSRLRHVRERKARVRDNGQGEIDPQWLEGEKFDGQF